MYNLTHAFPLCFCTKCHISVHFFQKNLHKRDNCVTFAADFNQFKVKNEENSTYFDGFCRS